MKINFILIFSVILFFLLSGNISANDDPGSWKYFRIDADINSNRLFTDIQTELGIKEIENAYTLIVNIADTLLQNQYIEFIHQNTGAKRRYSWYELSEVTQHALLELTGPEKTKISVSGDADEKYFRIYANIKDSPLFINVQKELLKNEHLLETYTLTVNVSDPITANNYVVFGYEDVKDPVRFAWYELSSQSREALLNWKDKVKIEKN